MSGTYGLAPPWDTDQAALNAAEIMSEVKAGSGKFRELPDRRLTCECTSTRKIIARIYVGADSKGQMQAWLWVPGVKPGKDRSASPPLAVGVPQRPGDPILPLTAICPRCKSGQLLVPGADGPNTVRILELDSPTYGKIKG